MGGERGIERAGALLGQRFGGAVVDGGAADGTGGFASPLLANEGQAERAAGRFEKDGVGLKVVRPE